MAYFMNQFIMTDEQGREWYIMQRDDGSIVLYYKNPGIEAHWVVFDDVADEPAYEATARADLREAVRK